MAETITGLTGTITGGSIGTTSGSMCDPALERLTINRMLSSGTNLSETFGQQVLRANADDQALAISSRRKFEVDMSLQYSALDILDQRSAGGQPQSGGGPGQPVSFPVQQQLPAQAPKVIAVSSTGQITSI